MIDLIARMYSTTLLANYLYIQERVNTKVTRLWSKIMIDGRIQRFYEDILLKWQAVMGEMHRLQPGSQRTNQKTL